MDQDNVTDFEIRMNAVDGRGQFRSGPQDVRELPRHEQQAASSFEGKGAAVRANAKEYQAKAVTYGKERAGVAGLCPGSCSTAKDLADVMRLPFRKYVQNQMRSLAEAGERNGPIGQPRRHGAAKPKKLGGQADPGDEDARAGPSA